MPEGLVAWVPEVRVPESPESKTWLQGCPKSTSVDARMNGVRQLYAISEKTAFTRDGDDPGVLA